MIEDVGNDDEIRCFSGLRGIDLRASTLRAPQVGALPPLGLRRFDPAGGVELATLTREIESGNGDGE